jgi:rubrerythrin
MSENSMSGKELLAVLEKARLGEEKIVSIYTKHLRSALFWTGMSKSDAEKVRAVFDILSRDSAMHKKMVEALIVKLKKEA